MSPKLRHASEGRGRDREPWALRYGNWIVVGGGLLAIALGLFAVFVLPSIDRFVGHFADEASLQRARADLRTSGLALATGAAAATAGLVAWGRVELSRQQHALDKESRRDERFSRAVELLGHTDGSVRLGALYALESLARDGHDAQVVYDVVSAFARSHVPLDKTMTSFHTLAGDFATSVDDETGESPLPEIPAEEQRTDDYEAAITICFRAPKVVVLDLRRTVIVDRALDARAGTILTGAGLTNCELRGELDRCSFQDATFDHCRIVEAIIRNGRFSDARFNNCEFRESAFLGSTAHTAVVTDCVFVNTTIDPTTTWPPGELPLGLSRLKD